MLLAAAAFYFVPFELLTAYAVACFVHEISHIFVLKLWRVPVYSFRVELRGFVIEHGEIGSSVVQMLSLLAGPTGGLVFAVIFSWFAEIIFFPWFNVCAAISLVLSLFNLLPCVPLDGGRTLKCMLNIFVDEQKAYRRSLAVSVLTCAALTGTGFIFIGRGYGCGAVVAGFCLFFSILFEEGIVKRSVLR